MGLLSRLFGVKSPEAFAKMVQSRLRESGTAAGWEFDPEQFALVSPEGGRAYLTNVYNEYRRAPRRERRAVVDRYLTMLTRAAETREVGRDEAITLLVPLVRDRFYLETIRLLNDADKPLSCPQLEINEELVALLGLNFDESISTVSSGEMEKWNLSEADAWRIARDNLYKLSVGDFVEIAPGVFQSPFRDTLDCSRMFMPDLLQNLRLQGPAVMAMPAREIVYVTGRDNAPGLVAIAELVGKALEELRPMSGRLFELQNGRWTLLRLPREHPAWTAVRNAAMHGSSLCYNEQKALLEQRHQKQGRDCYVATLSALREAKSGVVLSWTTWAPQVEDALMPVADLVAIMADKGDPAFAPWSEVMRVAGHRLAKADLFPVRYHATTWPTPNEIAKMQRFTPDRLGEVLPLLSDAPGTAADT